MTGVDLPDAVAILASAVAAGAVNAVVGAGTMITFPTLLALGFPAVAANVTNNVGIMVGSFAAAWGYRGELEGRERILRRLVPLSAAGAVTGAVLLLRLPERTFEAVVPVLIGLSVLLVVLQPRLTARMRRQQAGDVISRPRGALIGVGIFLAGIYGGYFGAAQGVLLLGLLGVLLAVPLQRANAQKNVLAAVANGTATLTFVSVAPEKVNWAVAGLIAVGAGTGGFLGARFGRRLSPGVLRALVAAVGITAVVVLVAR